MSANDKVKAKFVFDSKDDISSEEDESNPIGGYSIVHRESTQTGTALGFQSPGSKFR